jgi:hypothetical protein
VPDIGQHRPKSLALTPLDFIEPDVARLSFDSSAIPVGQECLLGASGFAPAHPVTNGRMTGRHRLTVHADLLP